MKVIIAGSRNIAKEEIVRKAVIKSKFKITEIISGTAAGVDRLGERIAILSNIKLTKYPAQWNKYGKSAGYKRNMKMAKYADALIAVWDSKSRGTQHMITIMQELNKEIFIYEPF